MRSTRSNSVAPGLLAGNSNGHHERKGSLYRQQQIINQQQHELHQHQYHPQGHHGSHQHGPQHGQQHGHSTGSAAGPAAVATNGGQDEHRQHQQPLITNITPNPVADNVTVEITEVGK